MLTDKDLQGIKGIVSETVNSVVSDAAEKILHGVQTMFDIRDVRLDGHDKKLDKLSLDIQVIKQVIREIKDDMSGINGELSLKVSRKDFETLKKKVEQYNPSN